MLRKIGAGCFRADNFKRVKMPWIVVDILLILLGCCIIGLSFYGLVALVMFAQEGKTQYVTFAFVIIAAISTFFLAIGAGILLFIIIPIMLAFIFFIKILMDIFE